ncbi:MAG: glycosyltransferase [Kiritimatiellia bacterium]
MEDLQMNGAVKSLLALLETLKQEPYELSLFLSSHAGELTAMIPSHVTLLQEDPSYAVMRLSVREGIRYALRNGRIDLVIARMFVGLSRARKWAFPCWFMLPKIRGKWDVVIAYADGFIGQVVTKKIPCGKKILWIHTDYRKYKMSQKTFKAFSIADGAVTVSHDSGEAFKQCFAGAYLKPFLLIHNVIDPIEVLKKATEAVQIPIQHSAFRLVSVGRITLTKGFDLIPAIAKCLQSNNLDFEWFIVGGGNDWERTRWEQAAINNGVQQRVKFIGSVLNPMPWVTSADIIVQPSRFEGWGMTVSEALILKKPIVVTDLAVFHEQIKDSENGLFASLDAEDFARKILLLAKSPELRMKMACYRENYPFLPANVRREFSEMLMSVGVLGGK